MEREHEIRINDLTEKQLINEYLGMFTYVPDNPLQNIYTLSIAIEDNASIYFKEGMLLFFSETKGLFKIPSEQKLDLYYHTLLTREVGFRYKDGVYLYKSL